MWGIAVHLLAGRYSACEHNDRDRAEWPPHPARLYSALVDASAARGFPPGEREALEWLEVQGPPSIQASPASHRDVPTYFVPVNDAILVGSHGEQAKAHGEWEAARSPSGTDKSRAKAAKALDKRLARLAGKPAATAGKNGKGEMKKARELFAQGRNRQARTFPAAIPEDPRVVFLWSEPPPDPVWRALDDLTARVPRLGHSSSLVTCALVVGNAQPTWEPDDRGREMLRVPGPGQLRALDDAFELHQGVEPRVLPHRKQPYRRASVQPAPDEPSSIYAPDLIVLSRSAGPRLPMKATATLAETFRASILAHAEEPVPELLSGHATDGRPSSRPHALFLPLPFVGHRFATGDLMGVGIALPRGVDEEARARVLTALARWRRDAEFELRMGSAGLWTLDYQSEPSERASLRASTWTRASETWDSVTPVALDRNPGKLHSRSPDAVARAEKRAKDTLVAACQRQGFPPPTRVAIGFAPLVPGSSPATEFPPYPRRKGPRRFRRVLVHASLTFERAVEGPLVLGAGRHLGLGLFRPCSTSEAL